MSAYKVQQRHLVHRGRTFHFVSYEGQPARPARQIEAAPATWCLMASGKRWEVMVHDTLLNDEECDRRLTAWLDRNVFGA